MNTKAYSVPEARRVFEKLVERALRGERIVFTRDGRQVAQTTAYSPAKLKVSKTPRASKT
jgi:antitoxin (DNA-binding transcriptional repressor) of toxin-antitoxin stability system